MIQDLRGYNDWTPGGVKPGNTEGLKFDTGKPPMSLINRRALEEEAKVLAYGAKKYYEWNWSKGMKWSRLLDGVMRHVIAFADGEDNDPETGLSHLAHARCGLGFLIDYLESHPEHDDRRRSNQDVGKLVQTSVPQLQLFSKL